MADLLLTQGAEDVEFEQFADVVWRMPASEQVSRPLARQKVWAIMTARKKSRPSGISRNSASTVLS